MNIKYLRWLARGLGVYYSVCIICEIVCVLSGLNGYQEPYHVTPLLPTGFGFLYSVVPRFVPFVALIPIIMLGIACKWPGRWPELAAGGVFVAWSLALRFGAHFYTGWVSIPFLSGAFFIAAAIRAPARS